MTANNRRNSFLKKYTPIFALSISFLSMIFSIYNQCSQAKLEKRITDAYITISGLKMQYTKQLTKEEALKIEWGYKPLIYTGTRYKTIKPESLVLLNYIVACNTKGEIINSINPFFTLSEGESALKQISSKDSVSYFKVLCPTFEFQNIGKTEARSLSILVDYLSFEERWIRLVQTYESIILPSGEAIHVNSDLLCPLDYKLPAKLLFKVNIDYETYSNNLVHKEINVKWLKETNEWAYGEVIIDD
ncbi:hypothetical protein ACFLTH_05320 [Bacteroidota bacterium]